MSYIRIEIRRQVIERAKNCCEYCRLSQDDVFFRFHIDHIVAEKHGGGSELDNLCLCCPDCNRFKGSDLTSIDSETGYITTLFDPRADDWNDHFWLNDDASIQPLTATGRVTAILLKFNIADRVTDRRLLLSRRRYPCPTEINR